MSWAFNLKVEGSSFFVRLIDEQGTLSTVGVDSLKTEGLPTPSRLSRWSFEGYFSSLEEISANEYLETFGLIVPEGHSNEQQVFLVKTPKGVAHVPAVALMRAFFKPISDVLPQVFRPANVDAISHLNYSTHPPSVCIDDKYCSKKFGSTRDGLYQANHINWLQLSTSARKAAQSVHINSLNGKLRLELPDATVRLILHGELINQVLYVTQVTLVSAKVSAEDSITKNDELFIFHAMAEGVRSATASVKNYKVTSRPDGFSDVSDTEWNFIEKFLLPTKKNNLRHSQREILNRILYKLSSSVSWEAAATAELSKADLTTAFRRWITSNRLQPALDYLNASRQPA